MTLARTKKSRSIASGRLLTGSKGSVDSGLKTSIIVMTTRIPTLALSHGQVLWCLAGGEEPSSQLVTRVRYLRKKLGIPFSDGELGAGRGVRILYDFYRFIEIGVAYEAMRQRIPPRLLEQLVDQRGSFHNVYRAAYAEIARHPSLFEGDPRAFAIFEEDFLIGFSDHFSKAPGKVTLATPDPSKGRRFGDLIEEDELGEGTAVIQLKSLMLRLLMLADAAPATRPGPKN
jgi:hypothetical protein